jgi:hypothetical protein
MGCPENADIMPSEEALFSSGGFVTTHEKTITDL